LRLLIIRWVRIVHSALFILHLKVVEPEVVATSPNRFKRPVPVCCGFSSVKMVLAVPKYRDTGAALNVVALLLGYTSRWRRANIGSSSRCCPGRIALQKRTAGCCMEAKVEFQLAVKREPSKDRATASQNTDGCDVASLW